MSHRKRWRTPRSSTLPALTRLILSLILLASAALLGAGVPTPTVLGDVGVQQQSATIPVQDNPDAAADVGPDGGTVGSPDGRVHVSVAPGALTEKSRVLIDTSTVADPSTAFQFDVSVLSSSTGKE